MAATSWYRSIAGVLLLLTICSCGCRSQDAGGLDIVTPRVRVESGELSGGTDRTVFSGRLLYTFLGVPYASPPVYKNRFKVLSLFASAERFSRSRRPYVSTRRLFRVTTVTRPTQISSTRTAASLIRRVFRTILETFTRLRT